MKFQHSTYLPVRNSWIVIPSGQETGWVFHSLLHIVHGGIAQNVIKELFLVGISPFLPFRDKRTHKQLVSFKTMKVTLLHVTHHSFVVNGMEESHIVAATSTNGTPRMAHLKISGAWLIVAPINNPPADRPSMDNCSEVVIFFPCVD